MFLKIYLSIQFKSYFKSNSTQEKRVKFKFEGESSVDIQLRLEKEVFKLAGELSRENPRMNAVDLFQISLNKINIITWKTLKELMNIII